MPESAESVRRAYLDALQIDVWTERAAPGTEVPSDQVPGDHADSAAGWPELRQSVADCTRCGLHKTRTQTVFGVGHQDASWMIIGEAPGAEEDRRGEPFVGRAGKLLDEMLRSVGLDRDTVFIANLLKCRPPNNRDPAADEVLQCRGYLERQIEMIQPRIILAVGRIAAQHLLQTDAPLGRLREQQHYVNDGKIPLVVTYHPAYLLRSPSQKSKSWQDLCMARRIVESRAA